MNTERTASTFKSAMTGAATLALLFSQMASTAYADKPYWAQGNNGHGNHHAKHHDDEGGEGGERGDDDDDYRRGYVVYQPVPVYQQPVYYSDNLLRCGGALAGAAVGGATGAVLGSELGHGKNAVIAGGAILGVLLGATVGRAVDDDDRACAGNAMAYAPVGRPIYWENPGAGIAYQIVPVRQYYAYGLPCREYTAKARIGGRNQRIHGTACRQPDGSWQVAG
jgi:surface antigen